MFGRNFIQQKSQLTLFDVCNLLGLDRFVVRHEDSFVPAPFSHMDPVFNSFCTVQNQEKCISVFGRFHTLKTESRTVNAIQSLCSTVEDLISTGAPSKGYVCLCLCDFVSMSAHMTVRTLYMLQKVTTKCADMPVHSTLNASITFSYGSFSSHACARSPTTQ